MCPGVEEMEQKSDIELWCIESRIVTLFLADSLQFGSNIIGWRISMMTVCHLANGQSGNQRRIGSVVLSQPFPDLLLMLRSVRHTSNRFPSLSRQSVCPLIRLREAPVTRPHPAAWALDTRRLRK